MNRIEKLQRMIAIAEELNSLQQELAHGMNLADNLVYERNNILEEIREDAEEILNSIMYWNKEVK